MAVLVVAGFAHSGHSPFHCHSDESGCWEVTARRRLIPLVPDGQRTPAFEGRGIHHIAGPAERTSLQPPAAIRFVSENYSQMFRRKHCDGWPRIGTRQVNPFCRVQYLTPSRSTKDIGTNIDPTILPACRGNRAGSADGLAGGIEAWRRSRCSWFCGGRKCEQLSKI